MPFDFPARPYNLRMRLAEAAYGFLQDWTPGVSGSSRLAGETPSRLAGETPFATITASPPSALPSLLQAAPVAASPGQINSSMHAWPDSALSSPGQALNPLSWPCQSEVLLQVRSSGGGPAAVCAAQAAVARTMAERQLARSLADAERRSSLVHRSARDVFSQAAANAHQQGMESCSMSNYCSCRLVTSVSWGALLLINVALSCLSILYREV